MVALTEQLLPGPTAVEKVTGTRPSYSTYFRWCSRGVKAPDGQRIKLAFVKAGAKRLTTVTAVREFFAATTAAASGEQSPLPTTNRQREAALAADEAELIAAGA